MLRDLLKPIVGSLTDEEYFLLLDLATDDIRANRIMWGKRTSLDYLIYVAKTCTTALKLIKKVAS